MINGRPKLFQGSLRLPPSKSYMHRALFISSLATKPSDITGCGSTLSDDVLATIGTLRAFGIEVKHSSRANGTLRVFPGETNRSLISVFARGSGTTARFTIAFAALAKEGLTSEFLATTRFPEDPWSQSSNLFQSSA